MASTLWGGWCRSTLGHRQHRSHSGRSRNVFAAGSLLATYDSVGTHFALADWLGTKRIQASATGGIDETCMSLPFGDSLTCTGPDATEHHFTGKEHDIESGNEFFLARYLGSTMGRFLTPDDGSDQFTSNAQSWNLYSYAQNNPVSNTDRNGHSVQICTEDSTGKNICKTLDNPTYDRAANGDNGGLNVPSERSVEMSGSGNITDANGSVVGTVKYVVDGGLDGPANLAGIRQLGALGTTMNNPRTYAAWFGASAVGGAIGAGGLAVAGGASISLDIVLTARVAGATLAAGTKVSQQIARTGATSPASLLDFARSTMTSAIQAGNVAQAQFGTIYRVGETYIVQNSQNVISSVVVNAEAGKGIVVEYLNHGGK